MPFKSDNEIGRITSGLIDRTLPKAEWTHAAHFAAAIWLLRAERIDAVVEMPRFIRAYNESTGVLNTDTSGYHETITLASLRAAKSVLGSHSAATPVRVVVNALLAGPLGSSQWMFDYWSKDVLFSAEARRTWTEPDIQALPF